jgi:hypothetical protein
VEIQNVEIEISYWKRPLEKPRHRCGTNIEANLEALKT